MKPEDYVNRMNANVDDGKLHAFKEARDIVRGANTIGWALHWLDKKIESLQPNKKV